MSPRSNSVMKRERTQRTCRRGHRYWKSSDCPTCPVCEAHIRGARTVKTPKALDIVSMGIPLTFDNASLSLSLIHLETASGRQSNLANASLTRPFMFGPTPATDIYIEASGADAVIGDVLQNGRVDGTLVIVALHYRPVETNYVNLLMKQFTIRGSIEYPERFEDAIELLERRDLSGLITHVLPFEAFGEGLAILEGSKDCGKVMITIGEDR